MEKGKSLIRYKIDVLRADLACGTFFVVCYAHKIARNALCATAKNFLSFCNLMMTFCNV